MVDNQTADDECGICLETLAAAAVTLPCNHKFCTSCLDAWKSKFASILRVKEKKSKSCPLCRKKIPPSKDMMIQLEYHRKQKRRYEERGDTTSKYYLNHLEQIKRLEEEIGDYILKLREEFDEFREKQEKIQKDAARKETEQAMSGEDEQ